MNERYNIYIGWWVYVCVCMSGWVCVDGWFLSSLLYFFGSEYLAAFSFASSLHVPAIKFL